MPPIFPRRYLTLSILFFLILIYIVSTHVRTRPRGTFVKSLDYHILDSITVPRRTDPQIASAWRQRPLVTRLGYYHPYLPEEPFPNQIWQTWKDEVGAPQFPEHLKNSYTTWRILNPNTVHQVITDTTARNMVRYYFRETPEVIDAYDALPLPVLKADFFRYLILLARGGVYSDIDTEALQSVAMWLPPNLPVNAVGLIVGIEADPDRPDWKDWFSRRIQFCQWTIRSKPGHPVLRDIVAQITEQTLQFARRGQLKVSHPEELPVSIVEFTGPARWTDCVFAYLNDPEYFDIPAFVPGSTSWTPANNITWETFSYLTAGVRVGDVAVLPITSFSPGVGQMGSKGFDDPMAFVKHGFEGSWKRPEEKIKPIIDVVVTKWLDENNNEIVNEKKPWG